MPNASAPSAPCVDVCESPQTSDEPGQGEALLRPDDVDDAFAAVAELKLHAELRMLLRELAAARGTADGSVTSAIERLAVGT